LASPASPESQAVHIRFVPNATHPLQQKQSFNYLIGARRRRLAEAQPPIFTALSIMMSTAASIVGCDRTPDNDYFRAKIAQEKLIKTSGIPYTIIRSTQFLEFLGAAAASSTDGNTVRISPDLFQPIAADDVAAIVADVALAAPQNGIVEIAGPERAPFNEFIARYLKAIGDPRKVVSDPEARYYGGRVEEHSLVPLGKAHLGRIGFDEWLRRSRAAA
jgi:uncharacterized protein YbjT (DUF2867 family)